MSIYCTPDFKKEFLSLKKDKKHYRNFEQDVISFLFEKEFDNFRTGSNLNNNQTTPFIKAYLKGPGGYRIYYYLIIVEENMYLAFIHPKRGPKGTVNVNSKYKTQMQVDVLESIENSDIYELVLNDKKDKISFRSKEKVKHK